MFLGVIYLALGGYNIKTKCQVILQLSTLLPTCLQGMQLAKDIRDRERGGRAQVTVVEGEDEKSSEEAMKLMKEVLGERKDIKDPIPDKVVEEKLKSSIKLFQ